MPSEERGASGQLFAQPIEEYAIGSWCPTPDGSGPPEAVSFMFTVKLGRGSNVTKVPMMLRLRSRRAVMEMIQTLAKHRDDVWNQDGSQRYDD